MTGRYKLKGAYVKLIRADGKSNRDRVDKVWSGYGIWRISCPFVIYDQVDNTSGGSRKDVKRHPRLDPARGKLG